jgi:beta-carotene 15,15'-dioxygenase
VGVATVLSRTRLFSVVAVVAVILVSTIMSLLFGTGSASWQVWVAVAALAIGIPHGALDHLVTVPTMEPRKMALFVSGYLAVVAVAIAAILAWPVWGFIGVVVMSAVHFGMGDASFVRQEQPSHNTRTPWWVYAVPAGSLPVVIPLTNQGSADALGLVNPVLVNWHFGVDTEIFWATIGAGLFAVAWLLARKQFADARDIVVLGALALTTPPLIAFAAYFGLWHALRHTARLSLEISPAKDIAARGNWVAALWRVSLPGLPALVGTMVVAAGITVVGGWSVMDYLWIALVLVWALTVPHMALTWRLDRNVLLATSGPAKELSATPGEAVSSG